MPETKNARERAWETRRARYGVTGQKTPALVKNAAQTPWGWLRAELQLSQRQFADLIGAKTALVSYWENGLFMPSLRTYVAMMRAAQDANLGDRFLTRTLLQVNEDESTQERREYISVENAKERAQNAVVNGVHVGWLKGLQK